MSRVQARVEVGAPPDRVWSVVSNPRNLPRWDHHIARVTGAPPDGLRVGSTYTTEIRFMGFRARIRAEVLELDEPRYSKVRLSGLLDATVVTRISPLRGNRSRVEHRIDFTLRGGPLGSLAGEALSLSGGPGYILRRGALAQKRQIEAER